MQKVDRKAWTAEEKRASKDQVRQDREPKRIRPGKVLKPGKVEKIGLKEIRKLQKKAEANDGKQSPLRHDLVNRSPYAPAEPFRRRAGDRLTVDLPAEYSSLDADADGQIGLYEWITVRRSDLDLFEEIDADFDGLLTPSELRQFDRETAEPGQGHVDLSLRYTRPRLQVIGGTWNLTARSAEAPDREELPTAYNPGAGRTKEERAKLHQDYVDRRMAGLTSGQKARIKKLWDEKQKNDPNMPNRGASFVRIMEYVAEHEK